MSYQTWEDEGGFETVYKTKRRGEMTLEEWLDHMNPYDDEHPASRSLFRQGLVAGLCWFLHKEWARHEGDIDDILDDILALEHSPDPDLSRIADFVRIRGE